MKKFLVLLLSAITFNSFASSDRPTATVDTGSLQGVSEYNMNVFKNIRYAAPPVGDLRWRPPQPAASWNGMRDAS